MKYAVIVAKVMSILVGLICFGLFVYVGSVNEIAASKVNLTAVGVWLMIAMLISLGFSALIAVYFDKIIGAKETQTILQAVAKKSEENADNMLKLEKLYANTTAMAANVAEKNKQMSENVSSLNFVISNLQESVNSLNSEVKKYNKNISEYFNQFASTSLQIFSQLPEHNDTKNKKNIQIKTIPTPKDSVEADYFDHYTQQKNKPSVPENHADKEQHLATEKDDEPELLTDPVILPQDLRGYLEDETKDEVQKSLDTIFNDELAQTLEGLDIMHDENDAGNEQAIEEYVDVDINNILDDSGKNLDNILNK